MLDQHAFDAMTTRHLDAVQEALSAVDKAAVFRAHRRLCEARDGGHTVYLAGNGGSAATASHWANDLGKAAKRSGRAPIRVLSLSDNTSWFTALGNDDGYDQVFAGQLENFAREHDVLVAISASGNSPNLVRAVDVARAHGVLTIGLVAFDGGRLRGIVDDVIWVPTDAGAYEVAEDAHMTICHALTRSLVADVAPGATAALAGARISSVIK